jgi:hypothetical protein
MTVWLLLALAIGSSPDHYGYTIAAYRSQGECKTALAKYDPKFIADGSRACVEVDPGTLLVLQTMQ